MGHPDIMTLIEKMYASWDAEVIFITSNYEGTQEMIEGCKEAGIPAFVHHCLVLLCFFLMIFFLMFAFQGILWDF